MTDVDMLIMVVSSETETSTLSLVEAKRRLEEVRAAAAAQNEVLFEALMNLDPDDESASMEDRLAAADKIATADYDADRAWVKYEKALIRYGWEIVQARKAGIVQ